MPVDTAFTYDAASRVTGITHTADLTTLADYSFTWDAAGQLTREVSNDGTANFTYDTTGQLTGVTGWRTESFSYDDLGNRTMSGYQTGTGNRLLSDGNFNYTYDNEGNLLTKTEIATGKVTEYTWDYRNRLSNVKLKDSGGSVIQESNYTYDPLDKRIGVSVDPDGDGPQVAEETWTVYDGVNPYADFDASGSLTNRYLSGPAVDMILARLDSSDQVAWYLTDHLGSVRDVADTTGAVIDHIQYDSFGNVLSETNPTAGDRFKFTGREYDEATGQYYYRARYHDAAVGRFISEDPIGFAAGDPNLARYVGNSPTHSTDPSGLQPAGPPPNLPRNHPDWAIWEMQGYTPPPVMHDDSPPRAITPEGAVLNYLESGGRVLTPGDSRRLGWPAPPRTTLHDLLHIPLPDPGISIAGSGSIPGTPISFGGGAEVIYDWANDGTPGTGVHAYIYPQVGVSVGAPVSIAFQGTYDFSPERYTGLFIHGGAAVPTLLPYVGALAGVSRTDTGWPAVWQGLPDPDPHTYYVGAAPGPNIQAMAQLYLWVYGTEPPDLPPEGPHPWIPAP